MSFRSAASAYDKHNDSATFNDSSTSSCDGENASLSLDSNTYVDDFTTPPLDQRKRRYRRVTGRTATPIPVEPIEHTLGPLNLHLYKQRPQLKVAHSYVKHHQDKQTAIPTRAKPEVAYLSEFYSPNRDPISPTTAMPQPSSLKDESLSRPESSPTSLYSLEDVSDGDCPGTDCEEECHTSPNKGACGSIKPPCLKLSAEFRDEPKGPLRAQTITDKEFYHFINGKEMATVMFYIKGRTSKSNMQVWDREAREETIDGDQAYGVVDCDAEPELCVREHIPSVPYFKRYCGGYPVYAGKRFKIYHS
ncbi:unnamed protein product [Candidula unifasciata]|uniref:Uncharacterized protein n=1 Tax=Candidula unifasciata TaxID=100452 RepID=A0A8S4A7Q6_9EUPU|nr:unnamed protein product [Candidula unifasciata]